MRTRTGPEKRALSSGSALPPPFRAIHVISPSRTERGAEILQQTFRAYLCYPPAGSEKAISYLLNIRVERTPQLLEVREPRTNKSKRLRNAVVLSQRCFAKKSAAPFGLLKNSRLGPGRSNNLMLRNWQRALKQNRSWNWFLSSEWSILRIASTKA